MHAGAKRRIGSSRSTGTSAARDVPLRQVLGMLEEETL